MSNLGITAPDNLIEGAASLAKDGIDEDSSRQLAELAGHDRRSLESARDQAAAQVRARVDDWEATAALRLLNRAIADLPPTDPFDWQIRWKQRRKP
jgi:hypothetical protein